MPSRFEPDPDPNSPKSIEELDVTKRYDVYCAERGVRTVVYRNVLIRGFRRLFDIGKSYDVSLLLELEQPNGQSVFVGRHDLACLCEHGNQVAVEVVSLK